MSTLVGAANLKDAVLTQDGPSALLASDPLRGTSTRPATLDIATVVPNPGGPWKPSASNNAWA